MKKYDEYKQIIDSALIPMLHSIDGIPGYLSDAMEYSLNAGGKRLRPVMLLAACNMAGGSTEAALPYACALEMIHTYSLIHDDLPAMDNDDLRRGKPTNHIVFGEGTAVLAGDGLLNCAAEIMLKDIIGRNPVNGAEAAYTIMKHAGVSGMIAGQTLDLQMEGKEPSQDTVSYIHTHKTADLLEAPMEAGLYLADAGKVCITAGGLFGYHLGIAFQITDDILDIIGDSRILGKNTGSDKDNGKMTWISLTGLEQARKDAAMHTEAAVRAISDIGFDSTFFVELARSVNERIN